MGEEKTLFSPYISAGVSECFKEPVLKTGDANRIRGFESLLQRHKNKKGEVFFMKKQNRTALYVLLGAAAIGAAFVFGNKCKNR